MKKNALTKVSSVLVSSIIILMIIIAGPAKAIKISFNEQERYIYFGNKTSFVVEMEIENSERVNIDKFQIIFSGPIKKVCEFTAEGDKIRGCDGVEIEIITKPDKESDEINGYGYRYYYREGFFKIRFNVDTGYLSPGIFDTLFVMKAKGIEEKKNGEKIYILEDSLKGCSIRASNGKVSTNLIDIGSENQKVKLSLNIPLKNAVPGRGSIQLQGENNRITYSFRVIGLIENTNKKAVILTQGRYRINRQEILEDS
ncbi:MAG: hypothetical protein QXJ28_02915, partial [Candidatus Pacearchaeota archaeon]